MGKTTKILLALLGGAAAGLALGVLIAPEKGSENRKKISDKAKKLANAVLEKAEQAVDKVAELKSKA